MAMIATSDLTEGTVFGLGVFDELMRAAKAHIEEEYQQNRLRGSDYASVYLGAMQHSMDSAVQFLLGKQQADKQAELLNQQALLTQEQVVTEQKRQHALDTEQAKVDAERQKLLSDIAYTQARIAHLEPEGNVLVAQKSKIDAESALLAQKLVTEQAQVMDQIDSSDVGGILGSQMDLYDAQANGFKRDAEQKAVKQLLDTWNVRRTTDEGTQAIRGITDDGISEVIDVMRLGIGLTDPAPPIMV